LTIRALACWPWEWSFQQPGHAEKPSNDREQVATVESAIPPYLKSALAFAGFACILRPTNIIVWATISIAICLRQGGLAKAIALAKGSLLCGSAVLTLSIAADLSFYGIYVLPPLKFIYFNVVQSLAVFYGSNRTDYYFTEGLPLLLTTALPFAAVGFWKALRQCSDSTKEQQTKKLLAYAVITTTLTLSLIAHKEVRFIYPLLPMLHILAAKPLANFLTPLPTPKRRPKRFALLVLGILANITIIYYTSFVHQRGVIDVMHYLRHQHEQNERTTIGFLMPCHSTPWRSHFIYPEIDAWALTCTPPLNLTMAERQDYLDEADIFYADPAAWIETNMYGTWSVGQTVFTDGSVKGKRRWPMYLVFFQQLEPTVQWVLGDTSYRECWRAFNTHWHDDWRRQGDVVVWCQPPPAQ
jgi:phosphatidylinositol glycan class B